MNKEIEIPAYYRKLIAEGKITEKEAKRLRQDWLDAQEFKGLLHWENTEQDMMEALSEMENMTQVKIINIGGKR